MNEITQADIDKAIQECYWRREVASVSICAANGGIHCVKAIDSGECEALRKLVNEFAEAMQELYETYEVEAETSE